jgi:hypothetical protein
MDGKLFDATSFLKELVNSREGRALWIGGLRARLSLYRVLTCYRGSIEIAGSVRARDGINVERGNPVLVNGEDRSLLVEVLHRSPGLAKFTPDLMDRAFLRRSV